MTWKLAVFVALVLVTAAISAGFALAAGGDDDQPLTGASLEKATAAALAHTGGGTVTETEVGDDGAAYGVEVRLADGRQVEVNLDENFDVIGQQNDDDGAGDRADGANDD
ncbi:MAG: PepSY domain-containing protein [Gaiellaceae bacterium]